MVFQSTRPARGATLPLALAVTVTTISIHAPREGRDLLILEKRLFHRHFNPRAPRGARRFARFLLELLQASISIHAPREGRDVNEGAENQRDPISIHAPREGRDDEIAAGIRWHYISIHAPREGRDSLTSVLWGCSKISIHAPREGRDPLDFAVVSWL